VRLGLGKLKKKNIHIIGSGTNDLPACSVVSQPLRYSSPPYFQARVTTATVFRAWKF
jgi:hypothetical protein